MGARGGSAAADERADLTRRCAALGVVSAAELGRRRGAPRPTDPATPVSPAPASPAPVSAAPAPAGAERPGPRALRTVPAHPVDPVPAPAPDPHPDPRPDPDRAPLPVVGPLAGLLPGGGLRRGSTVSVHGSTALLLALLAEASAAGSWCALVGLPGIGVQAAVEAGLDPARLALVPRPGPRPATVVAALVDGIDVVVLGGAREWRAGDRQRLAARVRQRGAVLVPVGPWPGADAELHATGGTWSGLLGDGAGRLRTRRVHVRCAARGRARDLTDDLLLPGPDGRPAAAPAEPGWSAPAGPVPLPDVAARTEAG